MEAYGIPQQVKVYSHSALHSFITSSQPMVDKSKSKTNPYRRRPGLLSFLGLNEVLEEVKREEIQAIEQTQTKEREINWSLGQVSEA